MAGNPPCMTEGCDQPATFVGTFFETGLSITVCEGHFVDFAAGTLEAMTGVPVGEIIAATFIEAVADELSPTPGDEPPSSESPASSSALTDTDPDELEREPDDAAHELEPFVVTPDGELDTLDHA